MEGDRVERVAQLLREGIGELLARRVKDPDVQGVTITDVRVSPDLGVAKVYFAAETAKAATIQRGLQRASSFLRRELGGKLRLKRTPELRFERDEALEEGMHIDEVLREIAESDTRSEP